MAVTRPPVHALDLGDVLGLARTSVANAAMLSGLESAFVVLLAGVFSDVARSRRRCHPLTVTAYRFAAATAVISPAVATVWISHTEPVPDPRRGRFLLAAVLLGVLGYAASFLLSSLPPSSVTAGTSRAHPNPRSSTSERVSHLYRTRGHGEWAAPDVLAHKRYRRHSPLNSPRS